MTAPVQFCCDTRTFPQLVRRLIEESMRLLVSATLTLLLGGPAATQQLTIPQIIEMRKPEIPRWGGRIGELAPRSFEDAARESDLIVIATVRKLKTYLSTDQTELYTDYEVQRLNTVAQRGPQDNLKPGPAAALVLRQWGGNMTIDGVDVNFYDEDYSTLPEDTPLLLFLNLNREVGKYQIFDGITGAFELEGNKKLRHLLKARVRQYERFNGMDVDTAILEIHRVGRR